MIALARARSVSFVLCALGLCAAGCGASAPPAESPASAAPEPAAPTTIAEAQEQIARASAELDALAGRAVAAPESGGYPSATASERASDEHETRAAASASPPDPCASPCRALASMRRAVDALCRMTDDDDERCTEARRTLRESTERVASCGCRG